MELEELKQNWQSTNNRLDRLEAIQHTLYRTNLNAQTSNRLRAEPIFELIAGAVTAIWGGGFIADNFAKIGLDPALAIPAVLLDALAIFTIYLTIRQLIVISGLDYSGPIIETQRRVAALRTLRVRSTQFVMLIGIPLWVIFPLLAGQAIFGPEFLRSVDKGFVVGNFVFGVLISGAFVVAARRFGDRSRFLGAVNDIFAGTEVARAQKLLADISDFEAA